jgi:hypothetical protein
LVCVGSVAARSGSFQQLAGKLLALDAVGQGGFGFSVALSGDGSTALIGGPEDNGGSINGGSVWSFSRSGSQWTQMGNKLFRGDAFGWSVALSADGKTALIGAPQTSRGYGAAFVFRRSGSLWVQEQELFPNDEAPTMDPRAQFGGSVALSADGNTALVGGVDDGTIPDVFPNQGAAWVFTRSGSSWSQQGPKLTGSGESGPGAFGASVALSGSGNLAVVGAPSDGITLTPTVANQNGAVWTFARSGSSWTAVGPKLTAAGASGSPAFGSSVALSADGGTLAVGGVEDGGASGAVWAYHRLVNLPVVPPRAWLLLGGKLLADGASGLAGLGHSVALSRDGSVLVASGPGDASAKGAGWLFVRSGSRFVQQPGKLTASDETGAGEFGYSAALAADGNSVLLGAPFDARSGTGAFFGPGAAWVFVNPPSVSAVAPSAGPVAGGAAVTVTGNEFSGASAVTFGSTPATSFKVLSSTQISAVAPAHPAGTVDLRITTSGGTSASGNTDRFTYVAARDTTPPTAPGAFRGGYVYPTLKLNWAASSDNVGVDHYQLYRNKNPVEQIIGSATTAAIQHFHTASRTVLTLSAFDKAGNRSPDSNPVTVTPRRRPKGVPTTIPSWATKLFAWQTTGKHGKRPKTPKKIPAWYAPWKAWRLAPYTITS